MAYGDINDLPKRTATDKVSRDKAVNIVRNPSYDGYQWTLAPMVYIFLIKKKFWWCC